jgi:hypothetical protein
VRGSDPAAISPRTFAALDWRNQLQALKGCGLPTIAW